jgi:allophanate hydrolase
MEKDRDFAGDTETETLYDAAIAKAASLGWEIVEVDYAPFREIAAALYGGAFVAERLAAVKDFFACSPEAFDPVVREIVCRYLPHPGIKTRRASRA